MTTVRSCVDGWPDPGRVGSGRDVTEKVRRSGDVVAGCMSGGCANTRLLQCSENVCI